jgi:hypothetical protein
MASQGDTNSTLTGGETVDDGVITSLSTTPASSTASSIVEMGTNGTKTPDSVPDVDTTTVEPAPASDFDKMEAAATTTVDDAAVGANDEGEDDKKKKKKKERHKVLKTHMHGIYTVKTLQAANPIVEWYKGLRASSPCILRLIKIYWSMSPVRASVLVTASLLKAFLPSLSLWVNKEFLDHVQNAADGKAVRLKRLLVLAAMGVGSTALDQGLNYITYIAWWF